MTGYITNGVLIGLHDHKAGQYLAIQKAAYIFVSLLALVIIACFFCTGDGGQKVSRLIYRHAAPGVDRASIIPPSPSNFPIGYIGPTRIVRDHDSVFPPKDLPESGRFFFHQYPAPGVFESPHHVDGAPAPLSTDSDFGLPEPPPLWRFAERGLPAGIVHDDITLSQPPRAVLVSPVWPDRVWLVDDTAVVEGLLTFHAHGLLSFELVSESHPGLGFGAAVQQAIYQATCFPSLDKSGNRITVRCRYRCLFFEGGRPSVSVGSAITARIKKD